MPTLRHSIRVFTISFLSAFLSFAASAESIQSSPANDAPEARFIQNLGKSATSALVRADLAPAQLNAAFHELFSSAFDTEAVGRFAIGNAWEKLPSSTREEYLSLFKDFILRSYGTRLKLFHGENFHVLGVRPNGDKGSVVTTEIVSLEGTPSTPIDWLVRKNEGRLSVVDVVIDGVSQSLMQRDELSSILLRNGGDFNAVLDALRERSRQASAD
jgi:phospholipid transport system substrate-binding protein